MRVILIGGNKTIYFLAREFNRRGYHLTIINRHPAEAKLLARQFDGTIIVGDGSDPAILEEAGARRADVLLSLTPHDPDNLIACQIAQQTFGVPRTLALVNDPDNEEIFRHLGITVAFSATRIVGTLIEEQTVFDEITNLMPVAEGRVNVTEMRLPEATPVADMTLNEIDFPADCLVAGIIRRGQVLIPRGDSRLQVSDRLVLITLPENQEAVLALLTGEKAP